MTGMDDLVTWLRAQMDDDERVAREAVNQGGIGRNGEKHWTRAYSDRRALVGDQSGNVVIHGLDDTWSPSSYQAEHIARWDPARVLAEVDAKRQMLELHRPVYADDVPGLAQCFLCSTVMPCDHAKLLALPYADRAGYREEWRP